ncbi:MAG TPA: hypothetical protein VHB51_03620 [Candidatus Saccharimonadales bacterium]|nr:hypothetical protein [Candidatus Saccharimonadales bacterium]
MTAEVARPPHSTGDELVRLLDHDVIYGHLETISQMDQRLLLATLVPHRDLPGFDPAGYIIARHNQDANLDAGLRTTYDLGVVFGRSLLRYASTGNMELPVVSGELDPDKQRLIDDYLAASKHTTVPNLTRNEVRLNAELYEAINLFAKRCETIVPHLMLSGRDELRRGFHDFLSVVTLLETDTAAQASTLRRLLGRISLSQRFRSVWTPRPRRAA